MKGKQVLTNKFVSSSFTNLSTSFLLQGSSFFFITLVTFISPPNQKSEFFVAYFTAYIFAIFFDFGLNIATSRLALENNDHSLMRDLYRFKWLIFVTTIPLSVSLFLLNSNQIFSSALVVGAALNITNCYRQKNIIENNERKALIQISKLAVCRAILAFGSIWLSINIQLAMIVSLVIPIFLLYRETQLDQIKEWRRITRVIKNINYSRWIFLEGLFFNFSIQTPLHFSGWDNSSPNITIYGLALSLVSPISVAVTAIKQIALREVYSSVESMHSRVRNQLNIRKILVLSISVAVTVSVLTLVHWVYSGTRGFEVSIFLASFIGICLLGIINVEIQRRGLDKNSFFVTFAMFFIVTLIVGIFTITAAQALLIVSIVLLAGEFFRTFVSAGGRAS